MLRWAADTAAWKACTKKKLSAIGCQLSVRIKRPARKSGAFFVWNDGALNRTYFFDKDAEGRQHKIDVALV